MYSTEDRQLTQCRHCMAELAVYSDAMFTWADSPPGSPLMCPLPVEVSVGQSDRELRKIIEDLGGRTS